MLKPPLRQWFCAALVAFCGLTLLAATSAEAGRAVRSSGQHVKSGHGAGFHQQRHSSRRHLNRGHFNHRHFKGKRFDRHRVRGNVVRRADRKRRHRRLTGYGYGYGYRGSYGYGGYYGYRDYPRTAPSYRSEPTVTVQPYESRPVTPKWVHVGGGGVASFTAEGLDAESGPGKNCLSVKTQITVDGKPMDAFGRACLLADGSWELRPSEETE